MTNKDEDIIKLEKRASYGSKFSVIDEIDRMVTESASKTSIASKIDDDMINKIKKQYEQLKKHEQNNETI